MFFLCAHYSLEPAYTLKCNFIRALTLLHVMFRDRSHNNYILVHLKSIDDKSVTGYLLSYCLLNRHHLNAHYSLSAGTKYTTNIHIRCTIWKCSRILFTLRRNQAKSIRACFFEAATEPWRYQRARTYTHRWTVIVYVMNMKCVCGQRAQQNSSVYHFVDNRVSWRTCERDRD